MTSLRDKIYEQLKQAMKAQDKTRVEALRFLWSLIKNEEIEVKDELSDGRVIRVVKSEVKKRKEAIEQMKQGGREELVRGEEAKLRVLEEFMPEEMGEEEIGKIVEEVVAAGAKDFGAVMGQVMGKVKGKADGKLVSEVVRRRLNEKDA